MFATAFSFPIMTATSRAKRSSGQIHGIGRTCVWHGDDERDLAAAGAALANGKLVAFPTETVYGLGADASNCSAVRKIFEAKGRPTDNPLIVHFWSKSAALAAGLVNPLGSIAQAVTDAFWPGPLTIVVPLRAGARVSPLVTAGLNSVAIRVPHHRVANALLRYAGVPVAAPSANLSGRPSPTNAKHVLKDLNGRIDGLVLDTPRTNDVRSKSNHAELEYTSTSIEEFNPRDSLQHCEQCWGLESTVVDLTNELCPTILRPGAVTKNDLERVCAKQFFEHASMSANKTNEPDSFDPSVPSSTESFGVEEQTHHSPLAMETEQDGGSFTPKAPGMKYRHYAPESPIVLCSRADAAQVISHQRALHPPSALIGLLADRETCAEYQHTTGLITVPCGVRDDTASFGRELYSSLRAFDGEGPHAVKPPGVAVIVAIGVSDDCGGLETAVMNRLRKAASAHI